MKKPSVGVVGLGIMGSAMAKNLIKAGYPVTVHNRAPAKAQALAGQGAQIAETPKRLAELSEIVFLMVTDPAAVWAVARGPQGVLAEPGQNKILIQSSTLDLQTTLQLGQESAKAGYRFLDCPVTGSKKQVEAAELILEAGGEKDVLESVRPVLMSVGKHIVHAGPVGAGTALKLCMNLIVAQMTTGLCEAVVLAQTLGINPESIFDVLEHSPALNCLYYRIKKEPLLSGSYPPAFSLANMLKDVRFMNQESKAKGKTLPVNQAVQALMEKALSAGLGEEDLTTIAKSL